MTRKLKCLWQFWVEYGNQYFILDIFNRLSVAAVLFKCSSVNFKACICIQNWREVFLIIFPAWLFSYCFRKRLDSKKTIILPVAGTMRLATLFSKNRETLVMESCAACVFDRCSHLSHVTLALPLMRKLSGLCIESSSQEWNCVTCSMFFCKKSRFFTQYYVFNQLLRLAITSAVIKSLIIPETSFAMMCVSNYTLWHGALIPSFSILGVIIFMVGIATKGRR